MANVTVKVDDAEIKRISKELSDFPEKARKAVIYATNRTIQSANTELQRNITANYAIKKKDLSGGKKYKGESSNNLIKVNKAHSGNLNASIDVRGSRLTLYRFVKGNKLPRNKKGAKGATVEVKKGSKQTMSRVNFIQNAKGDNLQLFQRHKRSRQISRLLRTISVAKMASNEAVLKKVQDTAQETLKKRVDYEIQKVLEG